MIEKYLKILIGVLIAVGLLVAYAAYTPSQGGNIGALSANAVNLVGTRVGTTTTGVAFTNSSTPVIYRRFVGRGVDEAILSIKTTAASVGTSDVRINFYTSNDDGCNTATSTGVEPYMAHINWYDALTSLKDLAGTATIVAATGTVTWTPTGINQGKRLVLTNLNSNCLRFDVAATGTSLYAELRWKQN